MWLGELVLSGSSTATTHRPIFSNRVTDFCQQTSRTNDARTLNRFLQGIEYKHSNHSIPLPSPLILTTYNPSQRSETNTTTQPHHFRTSPTIFGNPLPFWQQT